MLPYLTITAHLVPEAFFIRNPTKRRLLFGHVTRHDSLSKTIMQGTDAGGRRRGRQQKSWGDNTEGSSKDCGAALSLCIITGEQQASNITTRGARATSRFHTRQQLRTNPGKQVGLDNLRRLGYPGFELVKSKVGLSWYK